MAVAIAALGLAASASAQQPPEPVAADEASAVLEQAEQTLAPPGAAEQPPEATVVLNELAAAASALEGGERRRARGLLARPTDGAADQFGDGYQAGAPVGEASSTHFCVFWVNDAGFGDAPSLTDANGIADGDGIPDYVEAILSIAEFSYSIEVAPGALGWLPPKRDKSGCGADPADRADIYLKEFGALGLFGYTASDPGQQARSQYGYMVIDDDYAPTAFPGFADPLDAAKVTVAHEFNHLLQLNYDTFQDAWMLESTATWSEDHVYPEINDYVNYLPAFAQSPGSPITDPAPSKGLKIYGSNVWNHWLATGGGGFGVDAIRRAWEVSDVADPADLATSAYDKAIRDRGGKGFSREFARFLVATTEWRSGYGGFPDAATYPEMKRKGQLGKDQERQITLDHTAARLFNVNAGGDRIKLTVRAEDGVRAGLALVGRDGDALTGSVTKKSEFLDKGGKGSVKLSSPGRFERITAVVVNADGRVKGYDAGDWVYKTDDREFTAGLSG